MPTPEIPVLIVGAGPTGLTMALSLAKYGVKARIVEEAAEPHEAIRGTAIVPRTQELLTILGVKEEFDAMALPPLQMAIYDSGGKNIVKALDWSEPAAESPTVPYRNVAMISQANLEAILRNRLATLGYEIEQGKKLVQITQDAKKVTASLELSNGGTETVECAFLVAADGAKGRSRRFLNIEFIGETKKADRIISASVNVPGFSREYWHRWGDFTKSAITLKPIYPAPLFQLQALGPTMQKELPEDVSSLQRFFNSISGREDIVFQDSSWITEWRANIRMAEKLSSGRVFLAGDAAHCHSPTGGQGTNTGVQDAFNLAWKLALVHQNRAAASLLETYELERLPVIAEMLGLTSKLHERTFSGAAALAAAASASGAEPDPMMRAPTLLQLGVNYRYSPIVCDARGSVAAVSPYGSGVSASVRAGDRAPFIALQLDNGEQTDLFRLLGECAPNHLIVAFLEQGADLKDGIHTSEKWMARVVVTELNSGRDAEAKFAYGVSENRSVWAIIRPDGILGAYVYSVAEVDAYFESLSRGRG
ncbi:FAD binding domain-containing protein [Mycena galopus ATCC 62051]|nr:FAD binding domain-containing protein [Mycena galopus ATCC 62051]